MQRGVSSELFDSLKVYLNNKNRLQPIIGLSSIIECVKTGSDGREALYLCEVCVCRLSMADMRNHIMGSLHRYNYIKARHPHFASEWKENADLSLLAWPLMETAKVLEGKEGPGDIKLLEVGDAVFQKMARHSDSDAVTLINSLRHGQGQSDPERTQLEPYTVQSQRIVLLGQDLRRQSKRSHKTSAQTNKPPSLIQSTVASSVNSNSWLNNISTSQLDKTQMSANSNSFLDGYTGTKPLIGLFSVVECRSEDGRTYCFLCHCCRIRVNKKDIIDHLTSTSHLVNSLMESHPEQVEDINDNQHLQSLAKKVEQEEGRGELEVVNAPESLCILLTGKSYHWCTKMLCNGWTHNNIQKKKIAVKGPVVNKTFNQGMAEKRALVQSKERMTSKRKMRKGTNTVFKVSLPLTKGAVLLERTSFSTDSLPVSSYSPSADSDLIPSPETQTEECESDCDSGTFAFNHSEHTSMCPPLQLQQGLDSGDADSGQYVGPERNITVTQYQEVDGYGDYFNQSEDLTNTQNQKAYEERNYNRWHCSQGRSKKNFSKEWQNEGQLPAASHTQEGSSYHSFDRREEDFSEQWYNSTFQNEVGTRVDVPRGERHEISTNATQHYYQQQPITQYMAQNHTCLPVGSVGHRSLSGELAPHLDATRINMHPHIGDSHVNSDGIAPDPRVQFLEMEQRGLQTYMEFMIGHVQTAPQRYMTQPLAYQGVQIGHGGVMSNPGYNIGQRTNPDQLFRHPVSGDSGGSGDMSHSNAFIPPGQALRYEACSHLNFRGTGLSGGMISGNVAGAPPYVLAYPSSAYSTSHR
ncbi:uncharacterized protein si:ch211-199g17.2 [Thunnus albacares]|uniref:uncharacterized protein si:ch211-199g17.2 n=1 Tax=Thunnus albacares TaxID=8236 RepID=UPI001CF6B103|nr:uncharacterized protein si:ch211-199g17.2 [Thunnus albacares]